MKKEAGFSLIEIVVAIGLAVIFIPAIVIIFSLSITAASQGENFTKAFALAQEGMESVIYLKAQNNTAWDWQNTPVTTLTNEYYQPQQSGGIWQLGGKTTAPVVTAAPFTRRVEIVGVKRCGYSICDDPLALTDANSRKVIVYVSWPEKGQNQEVKLEGYVTAH